MPSRKGKPNPRVFVDANILVAAALSPTGGSFRLLQESSEGKVSLITNEYAVDESTETLRRKYPTLFPRFGELTEWSKIKVYKDPSEKLLSKYIDVIDIEDAPILAGAIKAKVDFLSTLDRKDFMNDRVSRAKLSIIILTPGDFFQKYFDKE